jgi:DNA polymerase-1
MRAVAGLSGDEDYIKMLCTVDTHTETAKMLFGTATRRPEAKKLGHQWNYGGSVFGIARLRRLPIPTVQVYEDWMNESFPRLIAWRNEVRANASSGSLLNNGFGRWMRPDPERAATQGPALCGQGAARDIMMEGLIRLVDAHPQVLSMLRAQVHDEIVLSVPADIVEDVRRAAVDAMTWVWDAPGGVPVPIAADSSPVGFNWGSLYEKG